MQIASGFSVVPGYGLPVHDRVGAQRLLMVGYRGAMEMIDRITNAILERRDAG